MNRNGLRKVVGGAVATVFLAALCHAPVVWAAKDVVLAVSLAFLTTDPYDSGNTLHHAMSKSFYEGLFGFDKNMKLEPVLAEDYTVSSDGLVYTIRLKKGIKFQDGTDFNAEAVKVNFDRASNPEAKLRRYIFYKNIAKTEAVDPSTVKVTLKEPFSPFVNLLAHPASVMISPAALKTYGADIKFHPVGTGPFKLGEWKQPDYIRVVKFDGYWKKGYPKVDSITWRTVTDNNTRTSMMQTGEAHFAHPVPYEAVEILKGKPALEVVDSPSIMIRFVSMNMLQKPFDQPKVREAINLAINRKALIKVAFNGYADEAPVIVPPGIEFSAPMTAWPYDPAKAKKLLTEAGYPNGFETELWTGYSNSTGQKVIQFLQQQLGQVGIKLKVTAMESGQAVEKVGGWQDPATAPVRMYYNGWGASTGEADYAIRPLLGGESWPPKQANTAYYKNDKVDVGLAAALKTTDKAEKTRIYREVQQQIWQDMPWAPLVMEKNLMVHNKRLTGIAVMPDSSYHFAEIDLKE